MDQMTKESLVRCSIGLKNLGESLKSHDDLNGRSLATLARTLRTYAEILEFHSQKLNRS